MGARTSTVDSWYAYNAGRDAARAALQALPATHSVPPCPFVFERDTDLGTG
jgi:hypothetical protein